MCYMRLHGYVGSGEVVSWNVIAFDKNKNQVRSVSTLGHEHNKFMLPHRPLNKALNTSPISSTSYSQDIYSADFCRSHIGSTADTRARLLPG